MKPILCNTEVVKNILAGRQTQDRRPMKPQPDTTHWKPEYAKKPKEWRPMVQLGPVHHGYDPDLWCLHDTDSPRNAVPYTARKSKYQPGDVQYVRETWRIIGSSNDRRYRLEIQYKADMSRKWHTVSKEIWMKYTFNKPSPAYYRWRPSIHMPKWAARIFLKVTAVWVERIRDISDDDISAEGVRGVISRWNVNGEERNCFTGVWEKVYPGSWRRNDWVFVYEFERCEKLKNKSN